MPPGPGKPCDVQATNEDSATSAFVPSGQYLRANSDVQTARGEVCTFMEEPLGASIGDLTMPSLGQCVSVPTMDAAASLLAGPPVLRPSEDELSSRFDAHEPENRIPPLVSNGHTPNITNTRQEVSISTLRDGYCSWTGRILTSSINSNQLFGHGERLPDGGYMQTFDRSGQFFETEVTASAGLEASVPRPRSYGMIPLFSEPASSVQRTFISRESAMDNRNSTLNPVNPVTRGDPCTQNKTLYGRNPEQLQLNGQVTIATDGHRRRFEIRQQVKRPDLTEFDARLHTFQNSTTGWKNASSIFLQQLANAGFYSIEGSNVKCFACDKELGDWDDKDDPFYEHVFWYGSVCAFVQAVMHTSRNMNGDRSRVSRNASTVDTPRDTGCTGSSQEHFQSCERLNTYDKYLREMGFPPDSVRLVIQRREREHGCERLNIDGMIEDLIKLSQHETPKDPVNCFMCKKEMLTGYTLCPCGHLCVCDTCCNNVKICPVCKGKITDKIKTFTKV